MPLPDFHSSEPYTLGIELELQVVNPPGYDLSQDSSALIAAVKDDIGRSTAPHHAAAARYHERDGECSATVAVTAVERCGERLCRASPREEPPPFFVAERFYAYRMGCLCRKGGRQQGERDEDWKSPVHGVVGLGISTRRSCGAFAGKCHAK